MITSRIHCAQDFTSALRRRSWIDDISMHADSFQGFADLFERILMRMATTSMQLKASKCFPAPREARSTRIRAHRDVRHKLA